MQTNELSTSLPPWPTYPPTNSQKILRRWYCHIYLEKFIECSWRKGKHRQQVNGKRTERKEHSEDTMVLDELPCPSCGVDHRWWSSSRAIAQPPIKSAKFSLSICFLIPSLKKKDIIRPRLEKSSSHNPLAPSPNPWIFLKQKGQKKSFFATPTCSS